MRSIKDWNLSVTEVVLEVSATSWVKCSGDRELVGERVWSLGEGVMLLRKAGCC